MGWAVPGTPSEEHARGSIANMLRWSRSAAAAAAMPPTGRSLCATSPPKLATANSHRPATPHLPPTANSLTPGDAFNCPPHSSAQLAPQQQGYRVLGALVVFDLTVALFVLSLVCVGETIRAKEDQSGTPQAWRNRGRRPSGSLMDPRGFGSPTCSGRALRPHRLRLSVRRCKTRSPMYS